MLYFNDSMIERTELKGMRTEQRAGKKVERFEDLIAWQKARELTKVIYSMSSRGPISRDFALSNQMQRAVVSIMSNIAEGFERAGRKEFHQFLSIAKGSCAEVRSLRYVALDTGYLPHASFESLMTLAEEAGRIVRGLRAAVENNGTPQDD